MSRRPTVLLTALGAVVVLVLALGGCSDDEGSAGPSTITTAPPDTTAPETSIAGGSEPEGEAPEFCEAFDAYGRYAAQLPVETIEDLRESSTLLADAMEVLLGTAPEAIAPQIEILKGQAEAIAASTADAATVEEANAAAQAINDEPQYSEAGRAARDYYADTCPAPAGG